MKTMMISNNHKENRIVLVGGGHAHAIFIKMWGKNPLPNVSITLVSNTEETPYSGMLPGLVSEHYTFEQTHINLPKLCAWANIQFICSSVTDLKRHEKTITTSDNQEIPYDILSINIGSTPNTKETLGANEYAIAVKPIATFYPKWLVIKNKIKQAKKPLNIALVGAGAGGFELISAIQAISTKENELIKHNFHWLISGDTVLPSFNKKVQTSAVEYCRKNNIDIHYNFNVDKITESSLYKKPSPETLDTDAVFWCAAAAPAEWPIRSGLKSDTKGFISTNDYLQTVSDACIFAVGDIATQINHPRPKAGVFAVRQGPSLYTNICNMIQNKPLHQHIPQIKFLSILATGNKTAIANRGIFSISGHWTWYWKKYIDLKFMNYLKQLETKA